MQLSPPFTWEGWLKTDDVSVHQQMFVNGRYISYLIATDGHFRFTTAAVKDYDFTYTAATGTWYYWVMIFDTAFDAHLYVNGAFQQTVAGTSDGTSAWTNFYIGGPDYYFDGILDESRVSNISRSAAWLKASYNSGNDSLVTYGNEQKKGFYIID